LVAETSRYPIKAERIAEKPLLEFNPGRSESVKADDTKGNSNKINIALLMNISLFVSILNTINIVIK